MTARDALISATKDLMSRHGFGAVSPRMILDASGAGQGSLYHHFTGKADLAGVALEELSSEMCTELDVALGATDDPLAALAAYLTTDRDALAGCRVGRLAHEDAIEIDEIRRPVAGYFDHVEAALTDLVRRAVDDGRLRPDVVPGEIAAALVAAVQGGYVLARVHRDPGALDRALRGAAEMLTALEAHPGDRDGAR